MKLRRFLFVVILLIVGCVVSSAQEVKKIAVLETVSSDSDIKNGVKLLVQSRMITAITELGGYEAYNRVDMSQIMGEHEFQRSGNVSDEQIKRIGEMHGVDYVLITKVAYVDDNSIIIVSQIIDIETAKVIGIADSQSPPNGSDLLIVCKEIAKRLLNVDSNGRKLTTISQQSSEQVTINSTIDIFFNYKSYNLEFDEDYKIKGVIEFLKNNPNVNVIVTAFNIALTGTAEENYRLCYDRLSVFVDELTNEKISPDRIITMYGGDSAAYLDVDYLGVLICTFE